MENRPHYIKIHNPKATKEENKGIITKPYDLIVIVDIAVNNRDYNTVFKFIESVKHKLLWIDHHYTKRSLPNCIIKKKDSCVELIQEIFPLAKYPKKVNDIIPLAHQTDTGYGENIFNHSLKVNLRSDEARYEIYRYLTKINSGEIEARSLAKVLIKNIRHSLLIKNSNEALKKWTTFYKNVAIIDAIDHRDKTTNSTYMFFECYKKTKCVIYKYLSTERRKGGEEYLKIARSNECNIHLPMLFNLPSGAKYRITKKNQRKPTPEEKKVMPSLFEVDARAPKEHDRWCYVLKMDAHGVYMRHYNGMIKYSDEELIKILDNAIEKIHK